MIWSKGSQKVYVEDGEIIGYVGPGVSIEDITLLNGWSTVNPPLVTSDSLSNTENASAKYAALIASGLSVAQAIALSGYNG